MDNSGLGRPLEIVGKILADCFPDLTVTTEDIELILSHSDVTHKQCVRLLRECLTFYESRDDVSRDDTSSTPGSPAPTSRKRRPRPNSIAKQSAVEEFILRSEDEVENVAHILRRFSVSQETNALPDIVSVAAGDVSRITTYLGANGKVLTEAMIKCQESAVQAEEGCGNIRIRAALWKIMYIDWYEFVRTYPYVPCDRANSS